MQTFLPYPDFARSASILDNARLGKQRVEARQILDCLLNRSNQGWKNHPAVKMWHGYEQALSNYGWIIVFQWELRGFRNSIKFPYYYNPILPPWFGCEEFHLSHKSNLLRKFPSHYNKAFQEIPSNLPYFWPL
ncbi:MAG: MSMEG_6728 family protein [Patescibacteria group bacterium]|nr:MSMEG_6728 family protein [Patescibacteria group bacterium]